MKQDKSVFLTATLVSILSLYSMDSRAESVVCANGYMLPAGYKSCVPCNKTNLQKASTNNLESLWCPGGSFVVSQKHQGIKICSAETLADSKHTKCEKRKTVSARSAKKSNSVKKAKDNASAARIVLKEKLPQKRIMPTRLSADSSQINCKEGTYLPMGGKSASDCKSCLDGYYCTGGKWSPDPSMDMGLAKCATGLIPDSTKTKCYDPESDKIQCKEGTYLPMGGKSASDCKSCLDGYYCTGGKWSPDPSMDQGLAKCAAGMVSNARKTACEAKKSEPAKSSDTADCKPGEYIPAKTVKCAKCSGSTKYCPGVSGKVSDIDQGIYLCPGASKPNSEKTACMLTLDKTMMQYGPGGQTVALGDQCWNHLTKDEYIKCMFGGKVVLP